MANVVALESRRGSTTQYQAAGLEHCVRHVSRRIKLVVFRPVMQVEVVSTSSSRRKLTLKYSEQFENDYDNDNYSNYVKDVSVHTGDSYQSECAMARIY